MAPHDFGNLSTLITIINILLILKAVHQITDVISYSLEHYGVDMTPFGTFVIKICLYLTIHSIINSIIHYMRRKCEKKTVGRPHCMVDSPEEMEGMRSYGL
jgi:ABC-type arginine/histidine transport system permease subunit